MVARPQIAPGILGLNPRILTPYWILLCSEELGKLPKSTARPGFQVGNATFCQWQGPPLTTLLQADHGLPLCRSRLGRERGDGLTTDALALAPKGLLQKSRLNVQTTTFAALRYLHLPRGPPLTTLLQADHGLPLCRSRLGRSRGDGLTTDAPPSSFGTGTVSVLLYIYARISALDAAHVPP